MTEPLILLLLLAGPACWMIGGGISGWDVKLKWTRRFLLPAICAGIVWMSGQSILTAILVGAATVAVNWLPYGKNTPWPVKVAVFFLLPTPALIINLWAFPAVLVGGLLITGLAYATRKWNSITHKIFEAGAGLVQASCLVISLLMRIS